jgi:hypothetical protein
MRVSPLVAIKGKYPTFGSKLYAAADKPLSPTKGRAP